MADYFGTDGIRGKANASLSHEISFKCGNALTRLKEKPRVALCRDTRVSGDMIAAALSSGVMCGGGNVVDCGILPTAALSYITRLYGAEFGVVISASHNPYEYNGIKIFGADGCKLTEEQEENIEELFKQPKYVTGMDIGRLTRDDTAVGKYEDYLAGTVTGGLDGLKIVLDCACGAAYRAAPEVFRRLGCELTGYYTDIVNGVINDGCGSLFPEKLSEAVKRAGADAGFAFDGDADRVLACDRFGRLVDGDSILYILACDMLKAGRLKGAAVVGTSHTNMGIQNKLKEKGILLRRANIGDKYVREMMTEKDFTLGGEQSGHIIIGDLSRTGDGILTALQIAALLKRSGKALHELNDAPLYPQVNLNLTVRDKMLVINNEGVQTALEESRAKLGARGRVMVRASGTEPKIRVMAECEDASLAASVAETLRAAVLSVQ
jgi:phosphoglucosamine mutase